MHRADNFALCGTIFSRLTFPGSSGPSHAALTAAFRMRRLPTRLLPALLAAVLFEPAPLKAAVIVSSGDASISHDETAGTWTLNAGGTSLKLILDSGRDFSIAGLTTVSGAPLAAAAP